ncbi:MAG: ABC transporter ATP-binding protein [Bradyrhizobiaceae bacterium]|nr:MAG: ABC transporter ATP-binding protein [Bradyrhizobiaceae bacterium]
MAEGHGNPLLSCSELTKRFGGVVALNGLTMDILRDEVLGIIGPNGSGKTTFFNVITGIFPATSGWVRYDGEVVTNAAPQLLHRKGIARTFQRSRLCLGLSIFDNLMIGNHTRLNQGYAFNLFQRRALRSEVEEQVEKCRELVRIFDPDLVDRIHDLVGNQPMIDRRRIEVCRALISGPKLLLLDEPSAGMTEWETRQLMENIIEVKRQFEGLSIVLIEHEMNVIERISDRCVVLNFGKKICEGKYSEVIANEQVQEAYLGSAPEALAS